MNVQSALKTAHARQPILGAALKAPSATTPHDHPAAARRPRDGAALPN